jgi:Arc/MetJ family transcription regulator
LSIDFLLDENPGFASAGSGGAVLRQVGQSELCIERPLVIAVVQSTRYLLVVSTIQVWHFICMKKTLHIDGKLLSEAKLASGAATDTDTVRLGLEALVRHAAYERLRALRGSEPKAKDIPRRRESAARKRRAA